MLSIKLLGEADLIELYFDKYPRQDIRADLIRRHWSWNPRKRCWYNDYTGDNLNYARKLSLHLAENSFAPFAPFGIPAPQPVRDKVFSFDQYDEGALYTTVTVTKKMTERKYIINSTNGQIRCIQCNKYIPVGVRFCPQCGTPLLKTIQTYEERYCAPPKNARDLKSSFESPRKNPLKASAAVGTSRLSLSRKEWDPEEVMANQRKLRYAQAKERRKQYEEAQAIWEKERVLQFTRAERADKGVLRACSGNCSNCNRSECLKYKN